MHDIERVVMSSKPAIRNS